MDIVNGNDECAEVGYCIGRAFWGCGIVADSNPASEWEESRLKLRTMLAALGGGVEEGR
jgi:isochorismate synthase EntC